MNSRRNRQESCIQHLSTPPPPSTAASQDARLAGEHKLPAELPPRGWRPRPRAGCGSRRLTIQGERRRLPPPGGRRGAVCVVDREASTGYQDACRDAGGEECVAEGGGGGHDRRGATTEVVEDGVESVGVFVKLSYTRTLRFALGRIPFSNPSILSTENPDNCR